MEQWNQKSHISISVLLKTEGNVNQETSLRESKKGNIYFNYQNPPGEKIEFVLKEIKVPL